MPKPTTTTTTSPTPPPTTTATSHTPTPTTPTTSPTATTATLTASDPLHTSNNTSTMQEATTTQPPTSSPVNTSTTTLEDRVEESDVFQTVSTRPDGRIAVTVLNKILMPTDKYATIISDSFCERVDPEGYRWANVSQNIKDFYWDEFKKNCFWEEQDDTKVRTAWKTKASLAYSQYVFNMRNPKRNKTKKKPNHVSEQIWASWWEKWYLEDFKKISDQNKVNKRNGVPDAPARPNHTSRSASHLKIASKLKRSLGCEPAHSEFFLYTHTKNHDVENFITEKDRYIHASYLEKTRRIRSNRRRCR